MILLVKGPKWQARLEAEKRGIVWDEDDPHNPPKPRTTDDSIIHCSDEYADIAGVWFCEDGWKVQCGYPAGTLLHYSTTSIRSLHRSGKR